MSFYRILPKPIKILYRAYRKLTAKLRRRQYNKRYYRKNKYRRDDFRHERRVAHFREELHDVISDSERVKLAHVRRVTESKYDNPARLRERLGEEVTELIRAVTSIPVESDGLGGDKLTVARNAIISDLENIQDAIHLVESIDELRELGDDLEQFYPREKFDAPFVGRVLRFFYEST